MALFIASLGVIRPWDVDIREPSDGGCADVEWCIELLRVQLPNSSHVYIGLPSLRKVTTVTLVLLAVAVPRAIIDYQPLLPALAVLSPKGLIVGALPAAVTVTVKLQPRLLSRSP